MPRSALIWFGLAIVVAEGSATDGSWSKLNVDDRESDVFVPTCAEGVKGVPMILSLHAWSNTKEIQRNTVDQFSQAKYIGPEHCFIVVYPSGLLHIASLGPIPIAGYSWNAGGCCPMGNTKHVDDIGYLKKVITETDNKFSTSSVFATGASNGGMLANRLACTDTRIKAIAPVAGPLVNGSVDPDRETETFTCSRRVPILHIHGVDDPIMPIHGCNATVGTILCKSLFAWYGNKMAESFPKIPDYIDAWRIRNGQSKQQVASITFKNGTTNCSSWGDVDSNVTLCLVSKSEHAWPGHCGPQNLKLFGLGCSEDMDASYHILSFFKKYAGHANILV